MHEHYCMFVYSASIKAHLLLLRIFFDFCSGKKFSSQLAFSYSFVICMWFQVKKQIELQHEKPIKFDSDKKFHSAHTNIFLTSFVIEKIEKFVGQLYVYVEYVRYMTCRLTFSKH